VSRPPESLPAGVDSELQTAAFQDWTEDYLDHLCAPLLGVVPYAARRSLRAEVREHLLALVEEFEDAGLGPQEATAAALREHGEPWQIGESFADEWLRGTSPGPLARFAGGGTLYGFAWFGLVSVPMLLLVQGYTLLLNDNDGRRLLAYLALLAVLAPFLAGTLTGVTAPWRAIRATSDALALLILVSLGSGLLMLPYTEGVYFALFQLLFWLPAGCVSASTAAALARSYRRQHFLRARRRATR
jgi:hypothetical protein